jgi:transcriptional regulator with XRE-family HTH domain
MRKGLAVKPPTSSFDRQKFAQRFRTAMDRWAHEGGRNQGDFAGLVGVSGGMVSKWMKAENVPGSDKIVPIALELGVSVDYLLLLTDDPRPPDLTTAERVYAALRLLVAPDSDAEREEVLRRFEKFRRHPLHGRGERFDPEPPA